MRRRVDVSGRQSLDAPEEKRTFHRTGRGAIVLTRFIGFISCIYWRCPVDGFMCTRRYVCAMRVYLVR